MALSIGQETLTNSGGSQIGVLAPGCSCTLTTITAAATAWIGQVSGTLLTTTNAYPVATGGTLSMSLPVTSQPSPVYGLGSAATVVIAYVFESNT
jgi:hypothetical protein